MHQDPDTLLTRQQDGINAEAPILVHLFMAHQSPGVILGFLGGLLWLYGAFISLSPLPFRAERLVPPTRGQPLAIPYPRMR